MAAQHNLTDAVQDGHWDRLLALLADNEDLVNSTQFSGVLLCTPLHRASQLGAAVSVVAELVRFGALRRCETKTVSGRVTSP